MVHGCMVYTECTETTAVSCGTSHSSAVSTPLWWILKNTLEKVSHSCRIACKCSKSAREQRIVLYKNNQQKHKIWALAAAMVAHFTSEEQKKLACDVFSIFATHSGLVHQSCIQTAGHSSSVMYTDCWTQFISHVYRLMDTVHQSCIQTAGHSSSVMYTDCWTQSIVMYTDCWTQFISHIQTAGHAVASFRSHLLQLSSVSC